MKMDELFLIATNDELDLSIRYGAARQMQSMSVVKKSVLGNEPMSVLLARAAELENVPKRDRCLSPSEKRVIKNYAPKDAAAIIGRPMNTVYNHRNALRAAGVRLKVEDRRGRKGRVVRDIFKKGM